MNEYTTTSEEWAQAVKQIEALIKDTDLWPPEIAAKFKEDLQFALPAKYLWNDFYANYALKRSHWLYPFVHDDEVAILRGRLPSKLPDDQLNNFIKTALAEGLHIKYAPSRAYCLALMYQMTLYGSNVSVLTALLEAEMRYLQQWQDRDNYETLQREVAQREMMKHRDAQLAATEQKNKIIKGIEFNDFPPVFFKPKVAAEQDNIAKSTPEPIKAAELVADVEPETNGWALTAGAIITAALLSGITGNSTQSDTKKIAQEIDVGTKQ